MSVKTKLFAISFFSYVNIASSE